MWRLNCLCLAAALIVAIPAFADQSTDTHRGRVTSVTAQRISMIDSAGDNVSFEIAADAKVTHNGKPAKLSDIDEGDVAVLTLKNLGGKTLVVIIEARDIE